MSIGLVLTATIVILLLYKVFSLWNVQRKSNTKGVGLFKFLFSKRDFFSVLNSSLASLVEKEKIRKGLVYFWLGPRFAMAAVDPETAKLILKSNEDFPKEQLFNSPAYLKDNFGVHLVSANGDDWKRHRTYVNSGFTSNAYHEYFPTFSQMTEKTLSKFESEAKVGDVELRSWFSKFTLDLLGNSIFHHDFKRLDNKSSDTYESYTRLIQQRSTFAGRLIFFFPFLEYLPLPGIKQFYTAVDNLKSLFHQLIKERQSGQKYDDILSNLLKSTETEGNGGLSQVEIMSNLWIFFLAGHETTSTALTYECICLAKYPDIQEKVYQEIEQTIGSEKPTLEDLSKLQYLDCFINETLRLYPPAPLLPTRVASHEIKIENQVIPKGTAVAIFISAIHKHPDFWTNPEKFDPDRFLPENKKGRHHYAFMPFSLGPRQCIGNNFSLIEQRLFLVRLLQKYRVLPPKTCPLNDSPFVIGETSTVHVHLEPRQ